MSPLPLLHLLFAAFSARAAVPAPCERPGDADCPVDDTSLLREFELAVEAMVDADRAPPAEILLLFPAEAPADAQPAKPRRRALGPADLYRTVRKSTLVLGLLAPCAECGGRHLRTVTAFAVASGGVVATNRHVLRDTDAGAGVMDASGERWPVLGVIAVDETADLALLSVPGLDAPPLPLASEPPGPGEPIWVLSHPGHFYYLFSEGIAARYGLDPVSGTSFLDVTAPYARGSSGAPVVDARGNVVSVVKSTRSLYTEADADGEGDLQMVVRHTIAVEPLRALLERALRGGE